MNETVTALKQLRHDAGVGFHEASRRLGVATSQLSRWERGKVEPRAHHIRELATLYGVSTDKVIEAIGPKRQRRRPDGVDSAV